MGRKELEAQLRELRKTAGAKPISKMKVTDISAEIERLKVSREETPSIRATGSTTTKRLESSVETVREAKESEYPVRPFKFAKASVKNVVSKGGVSKKATPPPKVSKVSKASLKQMLDELSDTDEE